MSDRELADAALQRVSARILAGRFEVELGAEVTIVPATQVVLSIMGFRSRNAQLDGRAVRLTAGPVGLLSADLTRSTGFHRLVIDGVTYWFGTEDAKLGLAGIVAMLEELDTMGTGWTGQAMFSDGSGMRDPHVAYGWLDQWADEALSAVAAVIETPRANLHTTRALRRRGGAGVLLAPTLRLLRSDPRRYLVESPTGVIEAAGKRYEPLRVVARKRESTLHTIANRRAIAILPWVDGLSRDVVESSSSSDAVTRARLWSKRARALQRRPLVQALGSHALAGEPRQAEETTDAQYRATYRIAQDLAERFGWSATVQPRSRLSYVEQSDAIYQAYAASRLARELGLQQTAPVLGTRQPAFSGDRFDLYYDTTPPPSVLRSWRLYSDRPDDSRPDLLLHERATGAVAVLDAKYRQSRDGGASEDSRKDVSSYMGLYGLDAVTILFPGKAGSSAVVEGMGQRIVELAISPDVLELAEGAKVILSTLRVPTF